MVPSLALVLRRRALAQLVPAVMLCCSTASAAGEPFMTSQSVRVGAQGSKPLESASPVREAEAADGSELRAQVLRAKTLAQSAWDAAETLRRSAVPAGEERKAEENAFNRASRELDEHLRAATVALRGYQTSAPLVPRAPYGDETLSAVAKELRTLKHMLDAVDVQLTTLTAIDDRNAKILEQATQKAAEAKTAAREASNAAAALHERSRTDKKLVEMAWLSRADAATAQQAAGAANAVAGVVARALQFRRGDSVAKRLAQAEKALNAVRGKRALVQTMTAGVVSMLQAGVPKGACDLRRADFANFGFPGFRLKNGRTSLSHDDLTIRIAYREVVFTDLDGDGVLEAFVSVQSEDASNTNTLTGQVNEFYAFTTDTTCHVKPLATIDGARGRVVNRRFVIDSARGAREWSLDGGRLVETTGTRR